jgi:hypothetical protein
MYKSLEVGVGELVWHIEGTTGWQLTEPRL